MAETPNRPTRQKIGRWFTRFTLLTALLLTPPMVLPCRAQSDAKIDKVPLASQRWREYAYGLSMRLPANARILERVMDDSVPWTLGETNRSTQAVFRNLAQRFTLDRIRADLKHNMHATGKSVQTTFNDPRLQELFRDPWAEKTNEQMLDTIGSRRTISSKGQAILLSYADDGALLRVVGDITYTLQLFIKQATKGVHINKIAAEAVGTVGTNFPSAILTTEKSITIAGRPAALLYYKIPNNRKDDAALGQALIQINSQTFAMLRLDTPHALFDEVRVIFESVLDNIEIRPPDELAEQRRINLERGQMWRQLIGPKQLHDAAGDTQLLRIVQGSHDIGFMTIDTQPRTELQLPGMAVTVQARIYRGPYVQDTKSSFFLSDDDTHEIWKINTTARLKSQLDEYKESQKQLTWAETGLRFENHIQVIRPGVASRKQQAWRKPDAYLSQVDLHMMERLLPHHQPQVFSFYTYLPSTNKISYRTVRVEPTPDGGYLVYTRATPRYGESIAQYDRHGQFMGRLLSGGRAMIPTTPEQLKIIWKHQPVLHAPKR